MSGEIEPLVSIVTTDLAAITRGRTVKRSRFARMTQAGVGWLPANLSLTPFNGIADPNPWGSRGDLRLVPDLAARFSTSLTGSPTDFDMVMGNQVTLDGAPWLGCPRTILRDALADLKALSGLELIAAFEQEFAFADSHLTPAHALSFEALRRVDPFAPRLMAALTQAGIEPEVVIAEFGADQFEITYAPASGVLAADRAIATREIVREVARNLGHRATFTPKAAPNAVGAGLHIHFSFRDASGNPVTRDPNGPGELSAAAAAFCAGIIDHLPAIVLFSAPSPVSYLRLKPHTWSASWTSLAVKDREAALRVCPTTDLAGDHAGQFNIEFRAADGTANPYVALAALVRAGISGLKRKSPAPPLVEGDPALMSEDERRQLGLRRLPDTLAEAIAAFERDDEARDWFPDLFNESFLGVRRAELAQTKGYDPEAVCALYKTLY